MTFGIGRIDANHAVQITKNMTEDEEMAHIARPTFPVEEWGDEGGETGNLPLGRRIKVICSSSCKFIIPLR
jgi:hypothetical protein